MYITQKDFDDVIKMLNGVNPKAEQKIEEMAVSVRLLNDGLEHLRERMNGVIRAKGNWQTDIFGKECWDINYSDILTKLIQDTGRYCDHYASDLFITWKEIEKELTNPDYKGGEYIFALRDSGVDHKEWYDIRRASRRMDYRKVFRLIIAVKSDQMEMVLEEI